MAIVRKGPLKDYSLNDLALIEQGRPGWKHLQDQARDELEHVEAQEPGQGWTHRAPADEIDKWQKRQREINSDFEIFPAYNKGGRVQKHGSSTCCLSKYPHTSKAR